MIRSAVFFFLTIIFLFFEIGISYSNDMLDSLKKEMQSSIGKRAPALTFTDLQTDENFELSHFKDKIILLKFWSLSCPPCLSEISEINKIQDRYTEKDLVVIYLSESSKEERIKYFEKNKVKGINGQTKSRTLSAPYQLWARPMSILIDPNQMIKDNWLGPIICDSLMVKIDKILDQK